MSCRGRTTFSAAAPAIIVVLLAIVALSAQAAPPFPAINLPNPGPSALPNSGLDVAITTDWTGGPGYVPFRVVVKPRAVRSADRDLTLRISTGARYAYNGDTPYTVQTRLTIPGGTGIGSPVETTLAIPDGWKISHLHVEVIEDGYGWAELTETTWLNSGSNNAQPTVLAIGKTYTTGAMNNAIQPVSFSSLPSDWVNLTSVQVIVLDINELKSSATNNQSQLTAIERWTRAGGVLAIVTSDDITADQEIINRALHLPPAAETWATATLNDIGHYEEPLRNDLYGGDYYPTQSSRSLEGIPKKVTPAFVASLRRARLGHGLIVAASVKNWTKHQDRGELFWSVFPGAVPGENVGLQPSAPSAYWNFAIPGVGKAPVWQFTVLITLFVIVIGPVNFYWLKRQHRLSLMLLTIPAGAAVVTLALIAYAFLADGLGVRMRARSFTTIDQQSGEAACAARLSAYAGLAPSGGLTFQRDTAVFPYESPPLSYRENRTTPPRTLRWTETEQLLESGWLPARVPTQLMTLRARETKAKLLVKSVDAGAQVSVVNQFGTKIKRVLVAAADGKLYAGENIAPDQAVNLKPAVSDDLAVLRRDIDQTYPVVSDDVNEMLLGSGYSSPFRYATKSAMPSPPTQTGRPTGSVLERGIAEVVALLRDGKIPPRTYLAIVEKSPEFDAGLNSYQDIDSFHLIRGSW